MNQRENDACSSDACGCSGVDGPHRPDDAERSGDAMLRLVEDLNRLEKQLPLIANHFAFRFFEKKAFVSGQLVMLRTIRDLILWRERDKPGTVAETDEAPSIT